MMCQHAPCIRTQRGPCKFLCLLCGEKWEGDSAGKAIDAPAGWQRMSVADLRIWYAREVLGAQL